MYIGDILMRIRPDPRSSSVDILCIVPTQYCRELMSVAESKLRAHIEPRMCAVVCIILSFLGTVICRYCRAPCLCLCSAVMNCDPFMHTYSNIGAAKSMGLDALCAARRENQSCT